MTSREQNPGATDRDPDETTFTRISSAIAAEYLRRAIERGARIEFPPVLPPNDPEPQSFVTLEPETTTEI